MSDTTDTSDTGESSERIGSSQSSQSNGSNETTERSRLEPSTDRDRSGPFERDDSSGRSRRSVLGTTATVFAVGTLGGLPAGAAAQDGAMREVMGVGNRADGSVTVVDADTYEVLYEVDVTPDGDWPSPLNPTKKIAFPIVNELGGGTNYVQDVDFSPDGRTLYVARGHMADVVAVDVETGELGWRNEMIGFRADHQRITPDGEHLFTSDVMANRVYKIDTETGETVGEFEATTWPHGIEFLDGGDTVVNGSLGRMIGPESIDGDHRLTFADAETLEVSKTIDFDQGVRPFMFTSDEETVYVQLSYYHGFHEVDVETGEILRSRDLPVTDQVPEDEDDYPLKSAHHGLELSPDDEYVCVAGTTSGYAAVVERESFEIVGTPQVGKHPYWCENAPDGEHCFVALKGDDVVSVIEYESGEEVARIDVGADPMVMETETVPESLIETMQDDGGDEDEDDGWFDW